MKKHEKTRSMMTFNSVDKSKEEAILRQKINRLMREKEGPLQSAR